ncbi:hypothetical protein [Tellurirhabdus rosea]|uniref:hypothetical protein n=1 Tax=Tellurirhabdus rosea TaxID=2674997 RepID=UPI00225465C7|nr:hypothetical protein [Tellurirhabdus rosea]
MKTFCKVAKVSLVMAALGWMTAGCENRDVDVSKPAATQACKLQTYAASSVEGSAGVGRAERSSYEYDAQGRLVKTISTVETPTGGSVSTTVDYGFDEAGFLTSASSRTITRFATAIGKTITREKLQTTTYSYQNGRLAGYIAKSSGTVLPATTIKGTYEYDEAGNLLTETALNTYEIDPATTREIPGYTSGLLRTWKFSQNRLADYTEKSGAAEKHPRTIQNGLVTRVAQAGGYTSFEYDTQRNLTKSSVYVGERLASYVTQEWSGKTVSTTSAFRGFPSVKSEVRQDVDPVYGETVRLSVNTLPAQSGILAKYAQYADLDENDKMTLLSERTYTLQTNGQGVVTGTKIETKQNGTGTVTTTETFGYAGCN